MLFVKGILPLAEATEYLTNRFSKFRALERVESARLYFPQFDVSIVNYLQRVIELEKELDSAFPVDDIIRYYFSPLELREMASDEEDYEVATLGDLLLSLPVEMNEPYTIDRLIDFYKSHSLNYLIKHCYAKLFSRSCSDDADNVDDISSFASLLDNALVKSEQKWAVIDIATNPVPHLIKLRELVSSVASYIESRVDDFNDLFDSIDIVFHSLGSCHEILNTLGFELSDNEESKTIIYQSLLSVSIVSASRSTDGKVLITLGMIVCFLLKARSNRICPEEFVSLLKLLSDLTRLNVLHDMCDSYTYGQELSERYKTTRSAMYYHLEKLMSKGLIDLKSTDYRMLYTMNKQNVYDKLTAIRDYLLNGWKPEKKDGGTEENE